MIAPTRPETVSLNVVSAALVKAATFIRYSIRRTGLGTHRLASTAGSRDAP